MQALFSPPGLAALLQLMRRHALLAFDFDGTLAPIVAHPPDARVPAAMALQLATLAACLPTAIITGRSVADVTPLLGFNPRYIIGNHGAEEAGRPLPPATVKPLEGLRRKIGLHTAELHQTGVEVEDKQQSFALHYRLAADHKKALDAIGDVLRGMDPALGFFGGKFVVNIVMANAPHKGDAMHDLIRRCGADSALFIGDDVNDESVFEAAEPHWLTVRVGRDAPGSKARFYVDDCSEVALMLSRMLSLLPTGATVRAVPLFSPPTTSA